MLHKPGAPWGTATLAERRPPEPGETWQCRQDKRYVTVVSVKDMMVRLRGVRSGRRTEMSLSDFRRRYKL